MHIARDAAPALLGETGIPSYARGWDQDADSLDAHGCPVASQETAVGITGERRVRDGRVDTRIVAAVAAMDIEFGAQGYEPTTEKCAW